MPQPQASVEQQRKMVLSTPLKRIIGSVAAVLPTSQFPHLKEIVTQLYFRCGSCKSGGVGEWYSFEDAAKVPMSGPAIPGRPIITARGMVTTRFGMHCPNCGCILTGNFVENGIIDLLKVPKGYRRPPMPPEASGDNVTDDDEGAAPPAVRASTVFGKGRRSKKKSDLNPKTRKKPAKKDQTPPANLQA